MAYNNYSSTEIHRGDIFFVAPGEKLSGSEQKPNRPGIVVSNDLANQHSPNVEMVFLTSQEKKPLPTHVEVICKVPSIALCENIQTVSKERLGNFVKSCTATEMNKINEALLISLGIERSDSTERELEKSEVQVSTGVEIERNLYKSLYEQLLDKVTSKV